mmetsp:Transcript_52796/g.140944  ORF Transcript_52796/g.140944 Transcript_52796/m.140944 type:complete len:249 (-) Transcript_52796:450-1196(-)
MWTHRAPTRRSWSPRLFSSVVEAGSSVEDLQVPCASCCAVSTRPPSRRWLSAWTQHSRNGLDAHSRSFATSADSLAPWRTLCEHVSESPPDRHRALAPRPHPSRQPLQAAASDPAATASGRKAPLHGITSVSKTNSPSKAAHDRAVPASTWRPRRRGDETVMASVQAWVQENKHSRAWQLHLARFARRNLYARLSMTLLPGSRDVKVLDQASHRAGSRRTPREAWEPPATRPSLVTDAAVLRLPPRSR